VKPDLENAFTKIGKKGIERTTEFNVVQSRELKYFITGNHQISTVK